MENSATDNNLETKKVQFYKKKYFYPLLVLALLVLPLIVVVSRQEQNLFSMAANATYTAGVTTKGPQMDSGNQNGISATQVTTGPIAGVLSSVSVYIGKVQSAPKNHMQVAVYTDSGSDKPGALLTTGSAQVLKANSWNTFVMNNVVINANTKYWLTFNVDGKNTQYAIAAATTPITTWRIPTLYGFWPSTFGTPTHPVNKEQYSIYMTYTSVGEELPTPQPTATPFPTLPIATPTSTPSISITPTTIPVPSGTSARGCPLPEYPRPDCVGVPAGTQLTELPLNDGTGYRVREAGTVIDGKHIKGYLLITADNVTVKNSQIDGQIINEYSDVQYKNTVITDTLIGPADKCLNTPGILNAEYTATRVHIRGTDDGFRAGGANVTVRDSYVKNCGLASSHGDGIQDYPATYNLVFDHNTMDLCGDWSTVPTSGSQCNVPGENAPIFIASNPTRSTPEFKFGSTNVTISNNMTLGGGYTVYLWPNLEYSFDRPTVTGVWKVFGNRVVNNTWDYAPYSAEGLCDKVEQWTDNTVVTIDSLYKVTSTVRTEPCPQ